MATGDIWKAWAKRSSDARSASSAARRSAISARRRALASSRSAVRSTTRDSRLSWDRRSSSSRRFLWKNSGTLVPVLCRGRPELEAVARARCSSMREGGAITKWQRVPPAARHSVSAATRGRPKLSSHQPEE